MTGEMRSIDQDGNDSNGECWSLHAAIAKAVGGTLQPFDAYQGPYISVGPDIRVGDTSYQVAVQHQGVIRLWISLIEAGGFSPEGGFQIWREDTDTCLEPFWMDDPDRAIELAKELLA